jgi:hypothetical protein
MKNVNYNLTSIKDRQHRWCDTVYQLLAHGRWFSPVTPASSTTKTGRHDIADILLKVVLSTKKQSINHIQRNLSPAKV